MSHFSVLSLSPERDVAVLAQFLQCDPACLAVSRSRVAVARGFRVRHTMARAAEPTCGEQALHGFPHLIADPSGCSFAVAWIVEGASTAGQPALAGGGEHRLPDGRTAVPVENCASCPKGAQWLALGADANDDVVHQLAGAVYLRAAVARCSNLRAAEPAEVAAHRARVDDIVVGSRERSEGNLNGSLAARLLRAHCRAAWEGQLRSALRQSETAGRVSVTLGEAIDLRARLGYTSAPGARDAEIGAQLAAARAAGQRGDVAMTFQSRSGVPPSEHEPSARSLLERRSRRDEEAGDAAEERGCLSFAYGTLRRGLRNYEKLALARNALFVGRARALVPATLKLWSHAPARDVPFFEAACFPPRSEGVVGEVFWTPATFVHDCLDVLEQHPEWYRRETVAVELLGAAEDGHERGEALPGLAGPIGLAAPGSPRNALVGCVAECAGDSWPMEFTATELRRACDLAEAATSSCRDANETGRVRALADSYLCDEHQDGCKVIAGDEYLNAVCSSCM